MNDGLDHPEGCTAPEYGRLLEDYLGSSLADAARSAFEEHYIACAACLEAIRLRQSGPNAILHWDRVRRPSEPAS